MYSLILNYTISPFHLILKGDCQMFTFFKKEVAYITVYTY